MNPEIISQAAQVLNCGGIVLSPTDTVWGLSIRCDQPAARRRLCRLKRRDSSKPFLKVVSSEKMFLAWFPPRRKDIVSRMFSRRLGEAISYVFTTVSGEERGVRWVQTPPYFELIERVGAPLISTSANEDGKTPCKNFQEACDTFGERVEMILNFPFPLGKPSKIVDLRGKEEQVLRGRK